MSQPTTAAGRALLGVEEELRYPRPEYAMSDAILAIEAEAVAIERARIRAAVGGLPDVTVDRWCRAAILALLDDPT